MQTYSIFELAGKVEDGVFIDNLMACSADRLISTHYYQFLSDKTFENQEVIPLLFSHDVLNLSLLVESIVCHEKFYINAEYINRWNAHIENNTLHALDNIIVPVVSPNDFRAEIERNLAGKADTSLSGLADLVLGASHHSFRYTNDAKYRSVERDLFVPYEEGSSPWGTPHYISVGLGYYLLNSQILGIPYKPSVFRAEILSRSTEISPQFEATNIAISLIEKSREDVARELMDKILERNIIEAKIPCILSMILKEAKSTNDIIPLACQIRDSAEAKAFRVWCKNFSNTVQNGDLGKIGEFVKELEHVTESINKYIGLKSADNLSVSLGWGPISIGYDFPVNKFLEKPIHLKRHMRFLHKMYSEIATLARISNHLERVLVLPMPKRFQDALHGNMNWEQIQQALRRRH